MNKDKLLYSKESSGLHFNPSFPTTMHIDINSCFATIEQQANPLLRGKPIAVAAYDTPRGVILAASVEAKEYGVKTGLRVKDGRNLYPKLFVTTPDSNKYRHVHRELAKLFSTYTNDFYPKSIDEFVLNFEGYPLKKSMQDVAKEIKERIRKEVGDWISVSVGIGTSRFIAKTASNFQKPDGLIQISSDNFLDIYKSLKLTDLHGINIRNKARLNKVGIYSVLDFYSANLVWLRAAFRSISAYYWYTRLRGWETCPPSLCSGTGRRVDGVEFARRSFGNQYAMPARIASQSVAGGSSDGSLGQLLPILQKLVEKTGSRMRMAGYKAKGINIRLAFRDGSCWQKSQILKKVIFDSRDIYKEATNILKSCPEIKGVRVLAEAVFDLVSEGSSQLELFDDVEKKKRVVESIDTINDRWGAYTIAPSRILSAKDKVPDRISFGGVSEL